ncbi:ABC transporter ATP-binding protein [Mumia sp. zg.B53]|uniref:ABC transporter ATP-binding protein n=1 Tax=unclassified Mumia TaxID=2621872 RepID=UPI001C6DF9DE|nr:MULTISPECIES: ABC transporter ATP-binding protein [unclassified Mumia]MBW9214991.1 ABC transporter ATP-binding protein [Mumia sp. zg.B53]MDD9349672.1 ABC transporter ATP-binding protein [Mumia sp.]
MSNPLRAEGVVAGYGSRDVLHGITFDVPPGQVTTVIGPNGCGKSTLLRTLAGLLRPTRGRVLLDGAPVSSIRPRHLARRLAVLPQSPTAPEGMTVADLVARGRQPHQPWYRQWSAEDDSIVAAAMSATGVDDLGDRPLDELSGGQRQRAWIAMALAQDTDVLLLDEPTTHLDLAHAVEVLDLVVRLRRDTGRTIVVVLHDLNLAARYSDHLVVVDDGRIVAQGPPSDVVDPALLAKVFGLEAHVFSDPYDALPTVVPVRRG